MKKSFKVRIAENSRLLAMFINENNIKKDDIVNILNYGNSNYIMFYYG